MLSKVAVAVAALIGAARAEENPAPPPPCDDSVAGIVIYCSEFYQAVQSQNVTFVAMTSMPASEWTDTIWNYTTYMTADARSRMAFCSMALGQYTAREDNCPDEYTAAGEYVSDCQACHNEYPDFVFDGDTGWTDGEQTRCLNFFVGVMEACWTAHRAAAGAPCFEACDDDFVTLQGTTHGLCEANLDCEWKERYDADTDSWSTGCGKRDPCPDEQAAFMAEVMAGCADPSNVTCVRALDLPSLSSWQALL
eukprot:COSAG06_NODE_4349_length_4348_cov_1.211815_1_plen_250_part_10